MHFIRGPVSRAEPAKIIVGLGGQLLGLTVPSGHDEGAGPARFMSQRALNGDLQDVARRVHEEFDEQLDATVVNPSLERVSAMFTDAKNRGFVPLLVRRYVNDELHERVEQA